ncbi:MAG: hypothetical protein PHY26_03425 [Bacilli bacterium]|jgi:hypothetical protein|nr:hypothetical protein [Bacilli bacterium]
MKILDKVKNFFYDEEEVEVPAEKMKEPTIKKEPKKKPKKEEQLKEKETVEMAENVDDIISERELFKSETTFKFPIIFEDDDLETEKTKNKSMNVLTVENNNKEVKKEQLEKKKFMPSPIISPVYGVLGQNYNRDCNSTDNDNLLNLYENTDPIDIDTVIGKAYGRKQEETVVIEKDSVIKDNEVNEIDLFKDFGEEKEVVKTTKDIITDTELKNKDNNEEEFKGDYQMVEETRLNSIDELLASTDEQDFYKLVDSMYENEEEKEEIE